MKQSGSCNFSFMPSGQRPHQKLQIFRRRAFLGHSKEGITERVYRRVGAIAKPKVMEHFTFLRPIKNPVDLDLRGFRMWRPKPESNRRGRICKPGLKSFITATYRLFGVPLAGDFQCLIGRIPPRLGLRLWTQKIIKFTALCWLSKTQGTVPTRLAPHSSWTYSAPVNTGLQQPALAATMPYTAGLRVIISLEMSLSLAFLTRLTAEQKRE